MTRQCNHERYLWRWALVVASADLMITCANSTLIRKAITMYKALRTGWSLTNPVRTGIDPVPTQAALLSARGSITKSTQSEKI
eukprot:865892-Pyramimonas_sp.AAC.2